MTSPAAAPLRLDARAIRGVILDLDGTLIDSYAPITASLNHARAFWDLDPLRVEAVRGLVGHGLESLIAANVGEDRVARGVELFREKYAEVFTDGTEALPGAVETLKRLHASGYRLAVASNKPARFSRRIVEVLGMARFLTCVMGPDTAGATKPDPAMIRRCLDSMGLAAGQALYVGDMVLDVESGTRAGLPVVLVEGGSAGPDELLRTGCTVLASLDQLCGILPCGPVS